MSPIRSAFSNNLRVDFYSLLAPRIIEEDQKTGTMAYLDYWDNPDGEVHAWDQQEPFVAVWDRIGLRPVLQRLFWCLEKEHGVLLGEIEAMDDLTDPDKCPVQYLPSMAASLGWDLDEDLPEKAQRELIKGLFTAYEKKGTPLSWTVFFRMLGYKILYYPLWKKEIAEDQDRYSRERYAQTTPFLIPLPGIFVNALPQAPLRPFTLRATDGVEVFRDDGKGNFIGSKGGTGRVNYLTGAMQFQFAPPGPIAPPQLSGETVVDEYPYHAARVDFDFFLVPLGGGAPPDVNDEFLKLLYRHLEEVRPIHVLVRTFNLVNPIEEDLENFVADGGCCGPDLGVDHWEAREDYYAGDRGPVAQDNGLYISRSDGIRDMCVEDVTPFIHPLQGDPLVITSNPPQAHDGYY